MLEFYFVIFAVPSLITVVITPANLPAPLQPRYSCLCSVRKKYFVLFCKFLANDHIRKHLLPRWSPQWYGDLVLKRARLWLVNYYFYIDPGIKDSCLLSTCLVPTEESHFSDDKTGALHTDGESSLGTSPFLTILVVGLSLIVQSRL